jgi:hypothetical protein
MALLRTFVLRSSSRAASRVFISFGVLRALGYGALKRLNQLGDGAFAIQRRRWKTLKLDAGSYMPPWNDRVCRILKA